MAISRPKSSAKTGVSPFSASLAPPLTVQEHLHRIETIGKRIDSYVQFMCKIVDQPGMSAETKERAVQAFYKQIVAVEKQLAQIHDELRLE
jgi:hypothetical protein